MSEALISASQVSYERHYQSVFGCLSLSLQAGDTLVLSGSNGSGKTTLMKILAGILRPTHGRIELARCHYVGHQHGLQLQLTVLDNLRHYLHLQGGSQAAQRGQDHDSETICLQALQAFNVTDLATRRVSALSAGQLKRAALARLLLTGRPLWLLDEPFVNLDKASINLLLKLLRQHCQQGGVAIIASHELGLADLPDSRHLRLPLRAQNVSTDRDSA
ncbi:MAG: heme ABC exporter ATP-binding protein CcmA [Wenzhouxiangellaceae bacterium]